MGTDSNTSRVIESTPLVFMPLIQSHVVKTIGERIRQAREAKDLSQLQLALMAKFKHQSAIGNLETRATGRGGSRITTIADALAVPVEWLLKGPDCGDADIPWKVPPGHREPGAPLSAREPASNWDTPIVQEALELIRQMSSAGQQEALRYLRYLAKQHAFPPSAGDGDSHSVPARPKAA